MPRRKLTPLQDFLSRKPDYTAARARWIKHLQNCRECDDDWVCAACLLQGEKDKPHTCNCPNGPGRGNALHVAYIEKLEHYRNLFYLNRGGVPR